MRREYDYDEKEDVVEEEAYTDSFLEKISGRIKNRKVPAYKKQPIHCDNVEVGFVEFNPESYVCVLDVKEVSQDAENESK